MAKQKGKKELDREALSLVKKEMAEPRMSSSAQKQVAKDNALTERDAAN